MRGAAFVALASLAASACGGARKPAPAAAPSAAASSVEVRMPTPPPALPSFEFLAARAAADAPDMREASRIEELAAAPSITADRDACYRVRFAAGREVTATLRDATGAARGETTTGGIGWVPPRGPACARKGETLRLVVEPPVAGRAIVFATSREP